MAPGISVPSTVPLDETLATSEAPRDDTSTPPQKSTMITAAV